MFKQITLMGAVLVAGYSSYQSYQVAPVILVPVRTVQTRTITPVYNNYNVDDRYQTYDPYYNTRYSSDRYDDYANCDQYYRNRNIPCTRTRTTRTTRRQATRRTKTYYDNSYYNNVDYYNRDAWYDSCPRGYTCY